jgi:hypothetical protein
MPWVNVALLYALQTHLPNSLNFHIGSNEYLAFGAHIETISRLSRKPINLPQRCVWSSHSSILDRAAWGSAIRSTKEARNAPFSFSLPQSFVLAMAITVSLCLAVHLWCHTLQNRFRQLIYRVRMIHRHIFDAAEALYCMFQV